MKLLVIGAGGHAKVVIDAAVAAGLQIAGVIGSEGSPETLLGHPVVTGPDGVAADGFIVAVGDNRERARTFAEMRASGAVPLAVVHPSALIADTVRIGAGAFVAAGVVVNPGATVGEDAILNTGCVVDHDCVIGDHAHVAPGAALCGAVHVGEGTLVGVGASAVPTVSIGDWTVVGAGAAVVGDLPAGSVCVGVPARPLRPVEG